MNILTFLFFILSPLVVLANPQLKKLDFAWKLGKEKITQKSLRKNLINLILIL